MPDTSSAPFETLLADHREMLLGRAWRWTKDREAAEDLVQEALLRAYAARHQFTPGTNLRAWLFCILDHLICDEHRQEATSLEVISWEDVPPAMEEILLQYTSQGDQPEWALLAKNLSPEMEKALHGLTPKLRAILWMTAIEELPPRDIAARLGLEVGAVKMRLSRARKQVRKALLQTQEEQDGLPASVAR